MAKAKKTLAPQQARSRESLSKLLKAAQEVLGQHGAEGATIPRIAEHAGLTPGAVYRRFHDKDALLETVILGMLERQDERIRAALTPAMSRQIPLPVLAEQLIHSMLVSYRANAGLIRAMRQFASSRLHTPFIKRLSRLEISTYEYMVELFLVHRRQIQHPDPKIAVSFALMTVISALSELVVTDFDLRHWQRLLPKDDLSLKRELTRTFLNYLGVEAKAG
ncbi:MAG TPA: TetR/AcrR family transcriptional regulator [Candidatus Angelobacter sp.]|nr:TetR/AcrR family transcriptional regulator [Candidatus Angelobacter sp.]